MGRLSRGSVHSHPRGIAATRFRERHVLRSGVIGYRVWLLIKWTPNGITAKEIVDLLETAAPLPRHVLEAETCRLVASLARKGFVQERPPRETVGEHRSAVGLEGSLDFSKSLLLEAGQSSNCGPVLGPIRPTEGKSEDSNGEEDWRRSRKSSTPVLI